jgi:hypothetical protein
MPDELERRLERALGAVAPPADETSRRAREAALAALPGPAAGRWTRRRVVLAAAAAGATAFVFGGVTLAATGGRLPLVSRPAAPQPHTTVRPDGPRARFAVPRGSVALAVTAAGRAWLATSAGASLRGRPLSALALSPGAVWVVEAGGGALRAVRTSDGRTGFVRRVPGTAAAAAWAPAGIRIAYVVRTPGGNRLYDMYGNGERPFLVAARTSGAAPSWRWDSRAFAYIRGDGRVAVHDPVSGATSLVRRGCGIRRAAAVAFAPFGGLLAIADRGGRVLVVDTLRHRRRFCATGLSSGAPALTWLHPRGLLVGAGRAIARVDLAAGGGGGVDVTPVPGRVTGLAAAPGGMRIAVAVRDAGGAVRVLEAVSPRFGPRASALRVTRVLLAAGVAPGPVSITWQ